MRIITLTPGAGFGPFPSVDSAVDRAMSASGPDMNWPPYNLITLGEDQYRIVLAVPGFTDADLEIVSEPNRLIVSGRPQELQADGEVVFRGIIGQAFKRTFELADHVRVDTARLADGLLIINLARDIPEALKPKRIEISGAEQPVIENPKQTSAEERRSDNAVS